MREGKSVDRFKYILYIIIAAFAVYIFWLNIISPFLTGDDLIFQLKIPADGVIGTERIHSLSDLIESQINFYKNYHYRVINHTVLQFILLLPPIVFDILNTCVFFLLPWVILKINKDQTPLQYLIKYVVILLFIWVFHFSLGWCYFPATGALNYTWMLIPQLWYIALILEYREGALHRWSLIWLALANSMANENVCVSLFLLTIWILWETRHRKDSTLYICLFIMAIGGLFMLSSPSIGKRLATQGHRDAGLVQHVLEYGRRVIYYFIRYSPILLLLLIGGRQRIKIHSKEILLFAVIMIATGVMIIVPLFEPRSAVFGFFVLLMLVVSLINKINVRPITIALLVVISSYLCVARAPAFLSLKAKHDLNHNILNSNKGADKVSLHKYCDVTSHDYILCHEISEDVNYFDNKTVAAFYNIDEVTLKEEYVLDLQRKQVYNDIMSDNHYLNNYKSIDIDQSAKLFYRKNSDDLDLVIRRISEGTDSTFYIFRAHRTGLLKHHLALLLPLSIQLYFLDYVEDLTERSQEKLYHDSYSYNYNYIANASQYRYILITKYSFEKHSAEGNILKLELK